MNLIRSIVLSGVVTGVIVLTGCGPNVADTEVKVEQKNPPAKALLEDVAKRGELGSAAMNIRDELDKMKAAGNPKADELLKDLDELQTLGKEDAVKKKAKAMADKL